MIEIAESIDGLAVVVACVGVANACALLALTWATWGTWGRRRP